MRRDKTQLVARAVALGAFARQHQPDRDEDDAWDQAWIALCDEFSDRDGVPRAIHDAARQEFLREFTHRG